MKFVILDTETTDFNGEVIQLAVAVLDERFRVISFDSFYCDTNELVSKGAYEVHGLSNELVHKLSGGKYLEDYLLNDPKYKSLFFEEDIVVMGFNVNFDVKSINNTLLNTGMTLNHLYSCHSPLVAQPGKSYYFDLMKYARRRTGMVKGLNLSKAVELLVPYINADEAFENVRKKFGIESGTNYHDAAFDTFCTILLFYEYVKNPC